MPDVPLEFTAIPVVFVLVGKELVEKIGALVDVIIRVGTPDA